ncbi:MAG: DUF3392 family protein [Fibrobacter sp.]|jgi:hypothetical protein|nr:DUF3392 family protein [Fibrobacter sp.]
MEVYLHQLAVFFRVHLDSISIGMVATVLVIYGAHINSYFQKITKSLPFLVRFALFVLLCSAGYALVSALAVRYLALFLKQQPDSMLLLIISLAFLVLAFLARKVTKI